MHSTTELIQENTRNYLPKGAVSKTYLTDSFVDDKNLVKAVFGFIFCGTDVLFTQEKDVGHLEFDIPGGHIEKGEEIEEALKREIKEETGVVTENFLLVGFEHALVPEDAVDYPYPKPDNYMLFYTGVVSEKKQTNQNGVWLSLDQARQTQWVKENRKLFEAMVQKSRYMNGEFIPTFLDVYNQQGEKTGEIASYDRIHRQGLWHKGVHIWVLTENNKFVVQKRNSDVQTKPNMYECAAAGHVDHGMTRNEIVKKELSEEIGLSINEDEIIYIGTIVDRFHEENSVVINNEFDDIVLIKKNIEINNLKIDTREVSSIELFDAKEFLQKGINGAPSLVFRPIEYILLYNYLYE